jgi:putative addiction module killer protein
VVVYHVALALQGERAGCWNAIVETKPRTVTSLQVGETVPFDDWLADLKDTKGKGQVEYRINKLRRGLLGEYDTVGDGVLELILDATGPGYRIYCVDDGSSTMLLCGGIKRTQTSDIARARRLWAEHKKSE